MTVFRDEANGSYFVSFYLKDPNRQGKYKHITKRGFSSKKDAAKWESDNANQTPTEETFIDICRKWEAMANASKGTIRQHNERAFFVFELEIELDGLEIGLIFGFGVSQKKLLL